MDIPVNYQYYDGWFILLHDGERIGPYAYRDDAERDAQKIASAIVAALAQHERETIERCAQILKTEYENLAAESKRIKDIDPKHSKYCDYLAYHAGTYAERILALRRTLP